MKNISKISALILVIAIACAVLCACGSSGTETKNVPVADISAAVAEAIGKTDALTAVDENWIRGWMKVEASQFGEQMVMINAYGANVDEYGIFKAGENMSAADIKATVEAYLQLRMDSWMDEYMPEEKPKLEDAEIKVIGDYVMYCILSESDAEAAFAKFEESLK